LTPPSSPFYYFYFYFLLAPLLRHLVVGDFFGFPMRFYFMFSRSSYLLFFSRPYDPVFLSHYWCLLL
jgi:hypothetical protein